MKGHNIVLIGLMGCGKTTVGNAYSDRYGLSFIDLDELIEKKENKKISDIFAEFGEDYFRKLESQAIFEISSVKNTVISTGGGVLQNENNLLNLKKIGTLVYLRASVDTLFERLKGDNTRPLLKCDNPKEKLRELLEKREKNYLCADIIVNAENKIDNVIEEINEKIKS